MQTCPVESYLLRCMFACLVQAGTLPHTDIPLLQVIFPHKDVHNQDNNSLDRNETKLERFQRNLIIDIFVKSLVISYEKFLNKKFQTLWSWWIIMILLNIVLGCWHDSKSITVEIETISINVAHFTSELFLKSAKNYLIMIEAWCKRSI